MYHINEDERRSELIDACLQEIAAKHKPTAVEIAERVKRKYYI